MQGSGTAGKLQDSQSAIITCTIITSRATAHPRWGGYLWSRCLRLTWAPVRNFSRIIGASGSATVQLCLLLVVGTSIWHTEIHVVWPKKSHVRLSNHLSIKCILMSHYVAQAGPKFVVPLFHPPIGIASVHHQIQSTVTEVNPKIRPLWGI